MQYAAIQDWMCEPGIIKKTGFDVKKHQELTINSAITLKSLAPEIKWVNVIQGWTIDDYKRHIDMYAASGIDLLQEELVGVGSICRRGSVDNIVEIICVLSGLGIKIHAFGMKISALTLLQNYIVSSDSMGWPYHASFNNKLPECTSHKNCSNCHKYALKWRKDVLDRLYNNTISNCCGGK